MTSFSGIKMALALVGALAPPVQAQTSISVNRTGHRGAACEILEAFIHEVRAQSGKHLSPVQAYQWIADALRIEAVAGC